MERRTLGLNGPEVGRVGLGTVKLGRNAAVKYPEPFDLPDDAAVEALLERALELGVNLWDTAAAYGRSEERLGPFVARHRDEVVLVSKAGEDFEDGVSRHDFSPAHIRRSCERSLRRLRTDHLDALLLHSDGDDLAVLYGSGAVDELLALREEGKVRQVGISAKTAEGVRRGAGQLDLVMAPFSPAQPGLASALSGAAQAGVGVLAIKTLASGHLAGEGGADPVADALGWVLSHEFVHCAVLGTTSPDHLAHAVSLA